MVINPSLKLDNLGKLPRSAINPTASSPNRSVGLTAAGGTTLWVCVVGFLLLGYLSMTRSFAYLGIVPLKIFIGELVLGAFLLRHPRAIFGKWAGALLGASPLSEVAWMMYLFIGYGVFQFLRGIIIGYSPLTAIQNLVFNAYPLYLFLGLWLGQRRPGFLPKFVRLLAWWNGIYGVAYLVVLSQITWTVPGNSQVYLIGQPGGSAVALLGLLSFEPNITRVWLPLLLNTFVMLGMQVRAELLGFLVGLLVWGWFGKQMGRMIQGMGIVVMLLIVGFVSDVRVSSPGSHAGEISTRQILTRVVAPISPEFAAQYSEHAEIFAGTVTWRTRWWQAIWESVHQDEMHILLGHGYGFPLHTLVQYIEREEIRTPHNVFYYALAYGGWIGVGLFFAFQFCLARLLWLAYRVTGQPFGIGYWAMALISALFSNFFETPFGAIPFYVLVGLAAAPALLPRRITDARPVGA